MWVLLLAPPPTPERHEHGTAVQLGIGSVRHTTPRHGHTVCVVLFVRWLLLVLMAGSLSACLPLPNPTPPTSLTPCADTQFTSYGERGPSGLPLPEQLYTAKGSQGKRRKNCACCCSPPPFTQPSCLSQRSPPPLPFPVSRVLVMLCVTQRPSSPGLVLSATMDAQLGVKRQDTLLLYTESKPPSQTSTNVKVCVCGARCTCK
jgi:hypothetical protein